MMLVILGHSYSTEELHRWINAFHMPLFFVLSGYIYKHSCSSFKQLICKNLRRYIAPYFIYSGIMFLIYGVLRGILTYGFSTELLHSLLKYIFGILYSKGSLLYMPLCTPLWFLTCFFSVTVLVWIADRFNTRLRIVILVMYALCGSALSYYEIGKLIWNIDTAFTGSVLLSLGRLLHIINEKYNIQQYIVLSISMIVLGSVIAFTNNSIPFVSFCDNRYGSYILMLAAAVPISYGFILLFLKLDIHNAVTIFIGKNTICFLAFNYLVRLTYNIVADRVLAFQPGFIVEFIYTIGVLILITLFINNIKLKLNGGIIK